MRRILLFIFLVIVLVSLNWFRDLLAQDLSSLSAEQKAELLRLYQSRKAGPDEPREVYTTPEIYEDVESSVPTTKPDESNPLVAHRAGPAPIRAFGNKQLVSFDELEPFGMELFSGARGSDQPVDIATSSDYVLGPGDRIIIYLWGRVEKEYHLAFDREGKVFIPQVGEVVGWGLTLEQFKARAEKQFSKAYSDFELTISLGKIRSIRIYVTGEVQQPGAYTVSSLTSLFNAIFLAGGPNRRGSMRYIKLMRAGKPAATVDLYKFLLEGDNSVDVRLQAGDLIFVPVAAKQVAIRGEVKRPAIYELKGEETALDLLELAGQPTAEAHLDRVMLERVAGKAEWEVIDLNLNQKSPDKVDDIVMKDGDRITVSSIFDLKKNMVAITGHVKHPGYYERNDTTRVADLLNRGQLQPYDVYYKRADLFRRHENFRTEIIPINLNAALSGDENANLLLQDMDSLNVYSIADVEWDRIVYIEGEVKRPGVYQLYDSMNVEDLIFLAGSFKRSADRHEVEIARIDSSGETQIVYVDLMDPVQRKMRLAEDDQLYVRRIPEWKEDRSVTIEGEVRYPGEYALMKKDETLYSLLKRAGGFTERAFPRGIVFERISIAANLNRLKVENLIKRSQPIVEDSLGNRYREQVFEYDPSSMNRIIIDVEKILLSKGLKGDIILEPNDHILVPSVPSGVSVMGAVGANGTIQFLEGKKVKDYIKRAGGFSKQADKDELRLIKATGEVYSGKSALKRNVELGDMVVVPTKIEKRKSWLKGLTAVVSTATGILTSAYIISKL